MNRYINADDIREQAMSNANLLYDECEKIIKAIDIIDDFLIKYSEFWNDITWRSNIDGYELYVDWGYFEEGMREIKNYCKQLRIRRASDD